MAEVICGFWRIVAQFLPPSIERRMTPVPPSCVPPGIPTNDCKDGNGTPQYAILTSFDLTTKAFKKGKDKWWKVTAVDGTYIGKVGWVMASKLSPKKS